MNTQAIDQYNELINILQKMAILAAKMDLRKQSNVRWLRRNVKHERAEELLKLCDQTEKSFCGSESPIWQEIVRVSYLERDALAQKYKEKGFEVVADGWPGKPPKINQVKLDFTPEEWVDLANADGEFLPACCATISCIRDKLISTLRNGGFIQATELYNITELMKDHGCTGPTDRLVKTWNVIKDDANLNLAGFPSDPNDLENAFDILVDGSYVLRNNWLTHEPNEDDKYHHKMTQQLEFMRIIPAIRTVYEALVQKGVEPMEGFAVCEGDKILGLRMGLAIFRTQEQAQETVDMFNKREDKSKITNKEARIERKYKEKSHGPQELLRERIIHKYKVRKVRVSLEEGIKFLEQL